MARRVYNGHITGCVAWIALFATISGFYWPHDAGIASMALSLIGVLHLTVLAYESATEPYFDDNMTPEQFEHYCADVLRKLGWSARVTQISGDQGADIVADKRGVRIVIQCKKYAKPVGNRAVQEIVAAIAHQDGDRGVVVTTSAYTPAAESLAASNDVLLLHHSELRRIDRLLK